MFPDGVNGVSEAQGHITELAHHQTTTATGENRLLDNPENGLVVTTTVLMIQQIQHVHASAATVTHPCDAHSSNAQQGNARQTDVCQPKTKPLPPENDIDDEVFHNFFQSPKSQWRKEYEACSRQDDMLQKPSVPPLVPMNRMDQLFEEMVDFDKSEEIMETNAIKTALLKHQRMALSWMTKRENNENMAPFWSRTAGGYFNQATLVSQAEKPLPMKGGILADDMGLGKTLVAISLILGNHIGGKPMFKKSRKRPNAHDADRKSYSVEGDPVMQARRSNGQAVDDDADEVKVVKFKRKKEGFFKPQKVTHKDVKQPGFKFRQIFLKEIKKNEKALSKMKKKSKKGKVKDEPKQLKTEEDCLLFSDSDEEMEKHCISKEIANIVDSPSLKDCSRRKSLSQRDKSSEGTSTLIICPMSVISNWTTQFQQHVDPELDLQLYLYYGGDRVKDVEFLQRQDIILTTYNTLAYDFRQNNSPLHTITWLRIILDEGHVIRNARSSQSAATVALPAKRRWVLTGTPIQNRMADLWTILKFLRFEPFTDKTWWTDILLLPMRNRNPDTYNRISKLMKHMTIRRMKTDLIDGKPIVDLPAKRVIIQEITLEGEQKRKYDMMQNQGKLTLSRFLRRGIKCVLRNYAHILVIIMRLRQLCCHPWLCKDVVREMEHAVNVRAQLEEWQQQDNANIEDEADGDKEENEGQLIEQLLQVLEAGDSEECAICLDNLNNAVITRCAHVFCFVCIVEVINTQLESLCPLCRGAISEEQLIKVPEKKQPESIAIPDDDDNEDDNQHWESSAKVDALITSLVEIRAEDPSVKSIIVSQFTSFLNLIQIQLRRRRFRYTRLDGSMNQRSRAEAIDIFNDLSDESPTIMLLSMNAGGVGLTLTAASRVFLMDPVSKKRNKMCSEKLRSYLGDHYAT
eukprot:gene9077-16732_t